VVQLQGIIGNQAVQRLIQRETPGAPAEKSEADKERGRVDTAISVFNTNAEWHKNQPGPKTSDELIETLTRWQTPILARDKGIDDHLQGDAALKTKLREAYIAALRALITSASKSLGSSESDLYREHNGQIPMWAWNVASQAVTGISTPLPVGVTAAPTGEATLVVNGVTIIVKPDQTVTTEGRAATKFKIGRFSVDAPVVEQKGENRGKIKSFTPPTLPTVTIRTTYTKSTGPDGTSGYGRGTTDADTSWKKANASNTAAAALDPKSDTVKFHEGNHGLDVIAYFRGASAPPVFGGAVGQTIAEWDQAVTDYMDAMKILFDSPAIEAISQAQTDEVGVKESTFAGP
jgi:hypothetical protein